METDHWSLELCTLRHSIQEHLMASFSHPLSWGLLCLVILMPGAFLLSQRQNRLPNVEFLRISPRPGGRPGDSDDVKAFLDDSLGAIMKSYNEYSKQGKHFLLRTPKQVYLIAATKYLDEIRKAPETHLSQPAAAEIIFQTKHTFHPVLAQDTYHFDVVKTKVTSTLADIIPELVDEMRHAFNIELGGHLREWTASPMFPLAAKLITRVSNRMLVGPDLCRNDEFLHYSRDYTRATFNTATVLRNYPEFLKPALMYFMSDRNRQQQVARKHLLPVIKQRLGLMEKMDRSNEAMYKKPQDTLQWLLDITPVEKRDPEILIQRMIQINVTAIHAPAVTLVECIFDLCRHPEIHEELRLEMADILGNKPHTVSWTRANVDRLIKMDSFIRESARLTPMSAVKMERYAIQDYRLSDGTLIPRGTSVGIIAHGRHIDNDYLENATTFDAFRYVRMRNSPETATQYTFAQTSPDNLFWGYGRHACPGRHFASVLIKLCLTYILVNFDLKFPDGSPDPRGKWTQKFRNPDLSACVEFRTREKEQHFEGLFDEQ